MAAGKGIITLGTYGGEPLTWQVLERRGSAAFLLSAFVITSVPFNGKDGPCTWADSGLRRWLNGRFLRGAFTPEEQLRILRTNLVHDGNVSLGVPGGPDTTDAVFCLSIEEARRHLTEADLAADHTAHALKRRLKPDSRGQAGWWLRSPGEDFAHAADVCGGRIMLYGLPVNTRGVGVRPALWVALPEETETGE